MADKFVYLKIVHTATGHEELYILRQPREDIDMLLDAWADLGQLSAATSAVLGLHWQRWMCGSRPEAWRSWISSSSAMRELLHALDVLGDLLDRRPQTPLDRAVRASSISAPQALAAHGGGLGILTAEL